MARPEMDRLTYQILLALMELRGPDGTRDFTLADLAKRVGVDRAELDAALKRAEQAGWLSDGSKTDVPSRAATQERPSASAVIDAPAHIRLLGTDGGGSQVVCHFVSRQQGEMTVEAFAAQWSVTLSAGVAEALTDLLVNLFPPAFIDREEVASLFVCDAPTPHRALRFPAVRIEVAPWPLVCATMTGRELPAGEVEKWRGYIHAVATGLRGTATIDGERGNYVVSAFSRN